jgi:hypothetical protein
MVRNFYTVRHDKKKLQPMVAEIRWTYNQIIMEICKDDLQRKFYLRLSRKFGWTKSVLPDQIENQTTRILAVLFNSTEA